MSKENNIQIFNDTLQQIEKNTNLKEKTKLSMIQTKIYDEDEVFTLSTSPNFNCKISVINERSLKAAMGMENVVVLNFASATHPGGGVINGSNAQEECLCRCSNLYPCLNQDRLKNEFYNYHKEQNKKVVDGCQYYSDKIIYSPNIQVIKNDVANPTLLKENDFYKVNIITSPAPNIRNAKKINQNELLNIFKSRITRILEIAILNGNESIVLGAFGCGAFRNPPFLVARAFQEVIYQYKEYFKEIKFAVFDNSPNLENYNTFKRILG